MKNALEKYRLDNALTFQALAERCGLRSRGAVCSHCSGKRRISPESALRYGRTLGIPLHELRPDLWAPRSQSDLKWEEAKLDTSDAHIPAPENRAQVLTAIARAVAALGEANHLAAETEARGITPADAREIRSALLDVIGESRFAMGMLQHIAEHRGVYTYRPLASLKPEEKVSLAWWKRLFKK